MQKRRKNDYQIDPTAHDRIDELIAALDKISNKLDRLFRNYWIAMGVFAAFMFLLQHPDIIINLAKPPQALAAE